MKPRKEKRNNGGGITRRGSRPPSPRGEKVKKKSQKSGMLRAFSLSADRWGSATGTVNFRVFRVPAV